jgi:ribosomal protein L11 methyltransferase
MAWLQLKLSVAGKVADELAARLEALGALAITYEPDESVAGPVFDEPNLPMTPLWEQLKLSALFSETTDPAPILRALQDMSLGVNAISIEGLADQDWSRVWMDRFVPLRFGNRLWIVPSWHQPPDASAINVYLDPGMAFGTGTHATTALCLEWLTRQHALPGACIVDYGCGSGILAIAAAKLGARESYAVDMDPQALAVAAANAASNEVAIVCGGPRDLPDIDADMLIANILLEPLVGLAPTLARCVRRRGQIALSGLLLEQVDACARAYSPWFEFSERCEQDGWALIAGIRRESANVGSR